MPGEGLTGLYGANIDRNKGVWSRRHQLNDARPPKPDFLALKRPMAKDRA
jgi:hypothetical protein